MKILMEAELETVEDLYRALVRLALEVKKEAVKQKLNPLKDRFPAGTEIFDQNSDGEIYAIVKEA